MIHSVLTVISIDRKTLCASRVSVFVQNASRHVWWRGEVAKLLVACVSSPTHSSHMLWLQLFLWSNDFSWTNQEERRNTLCRTLCVCVCRLITSDSGRNSSSSSSSRTWSYLSYCLCTSISGNVALDPSVRVNESIVQLTLVIFFMIFLFFASFILRLLRLLIQPGHSLRQL